MATLSEKEKEAQARNQRAIGIALQVLNPYRALRPDQVLKCLKLVPNAIAPFDGTSKCLKPTVSTSGTGWKSMKVCLANGVRASENAPVSYGTLNILIGSPTAPFTFYGIGHGCNLFQERDNPPSLEDAIKLLGKDVSEKRKIALRISGDDDPIAMAVRACENIGGALWNEACASEDDPKLRDESCRQSGVKKSDTGKYSFEAKIVIPKTVQTMEAELQRIVDQKRADTFAAKVNAAKKAGKAAPRISTALQQYEVVPELCTEITDDKNFKTEPITDIRSYIAHPDAKPGETKVFHGFGTIQFVGFATGRGSDHGPMWHFKRFVVVPESLVPKPLDIDASSITAVTPELANALDECDGDDDVPQTESSDNADSLPDRAQPAKRAHEDTEPPSIEGVTSSDVPAPKRVLPAIEMHEHLDNDDHDDLPTDDATINVDAATMSVDETTQALV